MIFSKAVLSAKTAVLDDKRQKCSVAKWIVVLQQMHEMKKMHETMNEKIACTDEMKKLW